MELKDIKIKPNMTNIEVNKLLSEYNLKLYDSVYLNVRHPHKWICKCGNIIESRSWDNIKRRNALLCTDCTGFKSKPFNIEDYLGLKFGRLTVIREADDSSTKHRKLLCICECGKIKSYYLNSLNKGTSKSCGCLQNEFEDFTGKIVNRLTVVGLSHKNNQGHYYWNCKCGGYSIVSSNRLKTKSVISCGCILKEIDRRNNNNTYDLTHEYGIGYTNKNQPFYFDKEDYDKIKDYTWHYKEGYVESVSFGEKIKMHNLIIQTEDDYVVDHINRVKYDNRKENLRVVKQSDNVKNVGLRKSNTSGITGVCYRKDCEKWSSYIRCDNKIYRLGTYKDKNDAIVARLKAENEYFKEFAPQKHLFEKYGITD